VVGQSERCALLVQVLNESSSGGFKFKLRALIVNNERRA